MARITVFSGEYDMANRPDLRKKLDRLAFESDVVLDFSGVTFVDSTCIAELTRLDDLRAANELDLMTVVVCANSPIHRLFEILGLCERFSVEVKETVAV